MRMLRHLWPVQPLLQWRRKTYYAFWVCVCGLRYPACNAHTPYCHLWQARFYDMFSTLSHKWYNYRKRNLEHTVFWLPLDIFFSETFLILRRNGRDMIKTYTGLHVKYELFSSDLNKNLFFSADFRKIFRYQISWKSAQCHPSFHMRMDRRTDMTKL